MKKLLFLLSLGCALVCCARSDLRVAVYVGPGACGYGTLRLVQIGAFARGVEEVLVDDALINRDILKTVDVLVVPGGSSPTMVEALGKGGVDKIRAFVAAGGGYIGTCAGAILGSVSVPGYREGMAELAPYATETAIARQPADVLVRWTPAAAEVLGADFAGRQRISYSWGPIFTPTNGIEGASFRTLATYDSEYLDKERPAMFGKVAVVGGTYYKGRVLLSAVHPEIDLDDHNLLRAALRFVSGRDTSWDIPSRARRGQLTVGIGADESLGVETEETLCKLMRDEDFDVSFEGVTTLARGAYEWLDVLVIPASHNSPKTPSVGLGKNTGRTKAFLARGGRIVAWGPFAADYAALGAGVTVVSNGTEAIDALRRIDRETKPIEVAYYTESAGSCEEIAGVLARTPGFHVRIVTGADIRAGALKKANLLVMPGGSSDEQYRSLGREGAAEVVRFVREGGAYYGICAGAFLASRTVDPLHPRLDLVPWKDPATVYPGHGDVNLRLTDAGERVFGGEKARKLFYTGGPVFEPAEPVADAEIDVLATYKWHIVGTAVTENFRPMDGRAAMLAGRVGKGRVCLQAPHPEVYAETFDLVRSALKYLTGREVTGTLPAYSRGQLVVGCEAPRDTAFANFYLKLIGCHNVFYRNLRYGYLANDLKRLDALIIAKPMAYVLSLSSVRAFAESGHPVYVVAETDEERAVCKDIPGITVVSSYDRLLPHFER